jgi:hypothetical protein
MSMPCWFASTSGLGWIVATATEVQDKSKLWDILADVFWIAINTILLLVTAFAPVIVLILLLLFCLELFESLAKKLRASSSRLVELARRHVSTLLVVGAGALAQGLVILVLGPEFGRAPALVASAYIWLIAVSSLLACERHRPAVRNAGLAGLAGAHVVPAAGIVVGQLLAPLPAEGALALLSKEWAGATPPGVLGGGIVFAVLLVGCLGAIALSAPPSQAPSAAVPCGKPGTLDRQPPASSPVETGSEDAAVEGGEAQQPQEERISPGAAG